MPEVIAGRCVTRNAKSCSAGASRNIIGPAARLRPPLSRRFQGDIVPPNGAAAEFWEDVRDDCLDAPVNRIFGADACGLVTEPCGAP